jgi:hypothetical protein
VITLQLWSRGKDSQFKRLVLIYKLFDEKTKRIYGLPKSIREVFAVPLIFAYLFHLISLRGISLIFDYTTFFKVKFKYFDPNLIITSGKLPFENQKCRVLLVYAKNCNFSQFDINLAQVFRILSFRN